MNIQPEDRVVDIGSGQSPNPRANVLVDKYWDENVERGKDAVKPVGKECIAADIEDLPFEDKEFDYAICNQVLEHVKDPKKAVSELTRVAKRGFISTPTPLWEKMFGRTYHKWLVWMEDGVLHFRKKAKNYSLSDEKMPADLWYATDQAFHSMVNKHWKEFYVQHEWEGDIEVKIVTSGPIKPLYENLHHDFNPIIEKRIENFEGTPWLSK